jgi:hypothetical protein
MGTWIRSTMQELWNYTPIHITSMAQIQWYGSKIGEDLEAWIDNSCCYCRTCTRLGWTSTTYFIWLQMCCIGQYSLLTSHDSNS